MLFIFYAPNYYKYHIYQNNNSCTFTKYYIINPFKYTIHFTKTEVSY